MATSPFLHHQLRVRDSTLASAPIHLLRSITSSVYFPSATALGSQRTFSPRMDCAVYAQGTSADVAADRGSAEEIIKVSRLRFAKYQGLGNDFILVNDLHSTEPSLTPQQAIQLCDRHFGIGGDGVIFALKSSAKIKGDFQSANGSSATEDSGMEKSGDRICDVDYAMRIFNSDGSEPEMCGNGIRCLAKFVAAQLGQGLQNGAAPGQASGSAGAADSRASRHWVQTLAGLMVVDISKDGLVVVDMGEPILQSEEIPTTLKPLAGQGRNLAWSGAAVAVPLHAAGHTWRVSCVSMGNPHCVVYGREDEGTGNVQGLRVEDVDLVQVGPLFEHHAAFPARVNTEFVEVISRSEVRMSVWERGAGITLACGTGACAVVVAGVMEGRIERTCKVHLPGGPLDIEWRESNNRVYMTGPAELVFEGECRL